MIAIAWGLLHSLWQGAFVGAAAEVALRALHGARPEVRYRVAGALLAAQVAAFLGTVALLSRPGPAIAPIPIGPSSPWPLWVVAAWIAGLVVLSTRLAGGLVVVGRLRRRSIAAPPSWLVRFDALQERLELAGVALRLVPDGLVPMAVGFVRPAVLVPASLLVRLPPAQLEAVLLHELAHVRRHDWLVNVAQSCAELLLFHHPATWWLSARIRHERELCCDALAVAAAGSPLAYARALADLESQRALVTAPAVTGGDLMDRILRLLGTPVPPRRASWLFPALAAGSVLGLASAVAVARTVEPDAVAATDPQEEEEEEEERPTEPEDVGAKVLELLSDKLEQGAEALEQKADARHERREAKKRAAEEPRREHHDVVVRVAPTPPPPPPLPVVIHTEELARALAEADRARAEVDARRVEIVVALEAAELARAEALRHHEEVAARARAEADRAHQAWSGFAYGTGEGCRTWRAGGTTVIVCQDGAADADDVHVLPQLGAPGWEAQVEAWTEQAERWGRAAERWAERDWEGAYLLHAQPMQPIPPLEPFDPVEAPEPAEAPEPPDPPLAPIRPRRVR